MQMRSPRSRNSSSVKADWIHVVVGYHRRWNTKLPLNGMVMKRRWLRAIRDEYSENGRRAVAMMATTSTGCCAPDNARECMQKNREHATHRRVIAYEAYHNLLVRMIYHAHQNVANGALTAQYFSIPISVTSKTRYGKIMNNVSPYCETDAIRYD